MKWIQEWDAQAVDRQTGERTGEYVRTGADDSWQRYWLDQPVESGVFLTPNWRAISSFHGRIGHVYALKVPEWVIKKSGGVHRYDHGSELLISEEIWNEAGDEIEFLGKSLDADDVLREYEGSYSSTTATINRRGTPRSPSWLNDEEMAAWKAQQEKFNLNGLRATNHPEDVIKLLTPEERKKAVAAIMAKNEDDPDRLEKGPRDKRGIVIPGTAPGLDEKDRELLALLRKHMNESIVRAYVRELLTESRLSGRSIQGVLDLLKSHADNTWIFFDTETTGMHPNSAQITEIGAIAVNPNSWENDATVLGQFNEKIKLGEDALETIAQQRADPESVKGKSVQDLLSMTRYGEQGGEYGDEKEVLDRFFEFVASFPNPMLVAQNASFDLRFVNVRSGGQLPSSYPVLDTMQLMKLYLIPLLKTQSKAEEGDPEAQALLNKLYVRKGNWGYYSTSMGVVSNAYGIDIEGWHNALADVQMMMQMYKNVVATIRRGMNVDIRRVQGRDLAYQNKRKKKR
jgi:DNA polymerase III epsilon subunit-like protein